MALKYYASVRIDVRRVEALKEGGNVIGNHTRAKVVKNKVAPPFREGEFDIMFGEGISKIGELVDMGVKFGFVQKSGAWFYLGEERLGQGRDAAKQYFKDHPDVADKVEAQIVAKLTGKDEPKKDDLADMRAPAPTAKARTAAKANVEVFADDFEDDD
jgi:recombination protein RecA